MEIGFYNENTAKNAPYVHVNGVKFFFSYSTCVGVRYSKGLFVRQNVWGTTTGKHLNWIDGGDKKERLTKEEFAIKMAEAKAEAGINALPSICV